MTFEEFAVSRLPAVLRFAAVLTGDRASAEDIVQEILIRAHRHWDEISRGGCGIVRAPTVTSSVGRLPRAAAALARM